MNKKKLEDSIILLLQTEFGFDDPSLKTTINDPYLIAGEDAERLMSRIADVIGVKYDVFFSKVPYEKYFDTDYGLAALPLVPLFWIKSKLFGVSEAKDLTVADFVNDLEKAFPNQVS